MLELWGIDHTSAFIQERLGITKNTARSHITHIYEKTGTASKEEPPQLVERFGGGKGQACVRRTSASTPLSSPQRAPNQP